MLQPGLYEQVINHQLNSELREIPEARKAVTPIDKTEASKILAQYLSDVVQKGLDNLLDNGGDVSAQIGLANRIVDLIQSATQEADFAALGVDRRAEQLFALLRENDPRLAAGKTAADLNRPETINKIAATFESYWNSSEFEFYSEDQQERLTRALKAEKYSGTDGAERYIMDVLPYPYQQEILDRLEAERTVRDSTRNLVVAATGRTASTTCSSPS